MSNLVYVVTEEWGDCCNRSVQPVAVFDTDTEADAHCERHNASVEDTDDCVAHGLRSWQPTNRDGTAIEPGVSLESFTALLRGMIQDPTVSIIVIRGERSHDWSAQMHRDGAFARASITPVGRWSVRFSCSGGRAFGETAEGAAKLLVSIWSRP